jgi:hypothetical protein
MDAATISWTVSSPFVISNRTIEPTTFGSGWVSGVMSASLGLLGLGAVLCFQFPELLTTPEARALYPVPWVRALLHLVLVGAFVLGVISLTLRRNKALGTVGVVSTLAAALLGGSRVPVEGELNQGPFLGLDWFLLNLILYSLIFIPLERLFARLPEQGIFRPNWHHPVPPAARRRRLHAVLGAPHLPRGAGVVAFPRRASLGGPHGLARRIAFASR